MGKEAVEIHNKLLEIIRPYVTRLCAAGVLPNRDFQTVLFYIPFITNWKTLVHCIVSFASNMLNLSL